MFVTWLPIAVEKVETAWKRPIVLILEKTDPHMTEILDVLLVIPSRIAAKVGV